MKYIFCFFPFIIYYKIQLINILIDLFILKKKNLYSYKNIINKSLT